jgi:hypothetical protein
MFTKGKRFNYLVHLGYPLHFYVIDLLMTFFWRNVNNNLKTNRKQLKLIRTAPYISINMFVIAEVCYKLPLKTRAHYFRDFFNKSKFGNLIYQINLCQLLMGFYVIEVRFQQVSILPTFYEQLFHPKFLLYLNVGFILFLAQES